MGYHYPAHEFPPEAQMPIDMHAHWIPEIFAEALRARDALPFIRPGDAGDDSREYVHIPRGPVAIRPGHADLEKRVADSEGHGVGAQVLSASGTFGDAIQCAPAGEAAELARIFNDGLAAACRDYPGRVYGVAALPCSDLAAAVEELDRAVAQPGIIGVEVPGNAFTSLSAAERFHPLMAAAQRRKCHILIHNGNLFDDFAAHTSQPLDNGRERRGTLEMQANLSSVTVTLCFTDYLDPYPDVTMQVHNLGGNIPYEIARMDHLSLDADPDRPPPSTRLDRIMVDCNSFTAPAIEMGVKVYGADKVMMGTDGSNFGVEWSLKAIADADIGDEARRAILDDNAARVIAAAEAA